MSAEYKETIKKLYEELDTISKHAAELKKTINMLSKLSGETPPFTEVDPELINQGITNLRADQFFGKPLATAIKEYLRMKGYAATAEEIFEALKKGGFEFSWKPTFQLKNLAISLSKNRNDFVYVKSNNSYGLWEFYPDKKREREKTAEKTEAVSSESEVNTEEEILEEDNIKDE